MKIGNTADGFQFNHDESGYDDVQPVFSNKFVLVQDIDLAFGFRTETL
jgi:hypothetical protein